jgi:hypothetical protein
VTLWECDNGYRLTKKLVVNPTRLLGGDDCVKLWKPTGKNITKMLCKLERQIKDHYNPDYTIKNFELSRCDFTVNIDVGSQKAVAAYIQVLHKIGKATGFTPSFDEEDYAGRIYKERSFDLTHAGGIEFSAYNKLKQSKQNRAKNILRIEVRLKKRKVIRKHTKKAETAERIKDLAKQSEAIFMDTFRKIVPRGDYYTMAQAEKRIADGVPYRKQREKMMCLLELTRKKSLHIALKETSEKNHERVIAKFAEIDVSPITLKKKYGVKFLMSLYKFLK